MTIRSDIFYSLIRIALAGIFTYAGATKVLRPDEFFIAIENYKILPHYIALIITYILPPFEIILGISLLTKKCEIPALKTMLLLMACFIAALTSAYLRGLDISCGCFGTEDSGRYLQWFLRDAFMVLAMLALIYKQKQCIANSRFTPAGE